MMSEVNGRVTCPLYFAVIMFVRQKRESLHEDYDETRHICGGNFAVSGNGGVDRFWRESERDWIERERVFFV